MRNWFEFVSEVPQLSAGCFRVEYNSHSIQRLPIVIYLRHLFLFVFNFRNLIRLKQVSVTNCVALQQTVENIHPWSKHRSCTLQNLLRNYFKHIASLHQLCVKRQRRLLTFEISR